MSRRPLLLAVAATASVVALAACGEQTPGGTVVDVGQATQSRTGPAPTARPLAEPRAEAAADATDPIVVKVGEQEYLTTMAIYRAYDSAKGGPLALGAPTAPAEEIGDGRRQVFAAGEVYWSPRTGARIVRGQILRTYLDNGGARGRLGWPVVDETSEGALVYSDFEHGRIKIEDRAIQVIDRAR